MLPRWHTLKGTIVPCLRGLCSTQDLASQAMDVAKGTKNIDEVVDAIREHEMQILNSLVGACCCCPGRPAVLSLIVSLHALGAVGLTPQGKHE